MNSFICLLAQVATSFVNTFVYRQLFFHPKNPKTGKLKGGKGKEETRKRRGWGLGCAMLCWGHCGCVRQPTSYISLCTQTTAEGPKLAAATTSLLPHSLPVSLSLSLPPAVAVSQLRLVGFRAKFRVLLLVCGFPGFIFNLIKCRQQF